MGVTRDVQFRVGNAAYPVFTSASDSSVANAVNKLRIGNLYVPLLRNAAAAGQLCVADCLTPAAINPVISISYIGCYYSGCFQSCSKRYRALKVSLYNSIPQISLAFNNMPIDIYFYRASNGSLYYCGTIPAGATSWAADESVYSCKSTPSGNAFNFYYTTNAGTQGAVSIALNADMGIGTVCGTYYGSAGIPNNWH